ncbi:sulfite exporter TauE/SafE family protein [Leuconostoc mesenteroides]|uniref:sulfite exporter TauE/SafE family protein n=1 Tax=Leuconostoc mesenteroides TaxID=1245 RepID=UPI00038B1427|nr:sulfite exporter TauE/SafE family protein [Leuconostoc mesenteroides]EQC83585.1 sodium:solute symporter [Leuconostoc mesenteroides subsp. cremoris TIFN8]ORI38680.1 sodium:solute symporter [Leuconostoc mesenteroides subsp. cremoris]ORI40056.1 sodium:solute symporter [Leuconostoc mesenteroides subsp. cremoris]ORI42144.1 sodium:solute symporter [Leuconostoc mesenteroides subsp. cremoris]ORI43643.1 sodium:solute symporter [Leuconostoc mesenteroides subsp. cremoris]
MFPENFILYSIQILLVVVMIAMIIVVIRSYLLHRQPIFKRFGLGMLIGFITDFGDTLGIGSFATTTAAFRMTHYIDDDRKLPGTLNAVHAIPVMFQALFFITTVKVELTTLLPMTTAAVIGAYVGTHVTKKWHAPTVQRVMAVALLIAVIIMVVRMITTPGSNNSMGVHGLHGWWLILGIVFNFGIGVLMTMGLGNYAPELIFFSLMGVNPAVAFPVMMLDAALIMPTTALNVIKMDRVSWRGFAGVAIGGVLGVIVAAKFFTSMNVDLLNKLIVIVALWTIFGLVRDSMKKNV